ncbi:MAG: PaaI family thioesterase [Proteobacteria bacterium]|nr:PaaI family thioesterase [Pseudomonadota bacterium]
MNKRLEKSLQLPLHKHLGIDHMASSKGKGSLDFMVKDHLINATGVLHGGVVYALLDVCAYAGLISVLADDQDAVTHDIHVSVMRPARQGDQVFMESNILKLGRTLCFIDVSAHVQGKIIARATITKSLIKRNAR